MSTIAVAVGMEGRREPSRLRMGRTTMDTGLIRTARGTWEAGVAGSRDGRVRLGASERGARAALVRAVVEVVAACGYEAAGVDAICGRAGVAPEVFAELFAGKQECFIAAACVFVDALIAEVGAAVRHAEDWESGTRAALSAALLYLAEHPAEARAFFAEGLSAGREALAVRDLAMHAFCDFIDMLQARARDALPSGLVSEAAVGGLYGILATRIRNGETGSLPDLASSLAYFLLAPVVGRPRARRELSAATR